ncbi:ATPase family AAA domain-containing protein 5b [Brachionichthys hirsutus]|uniref:ATPase family AAA domain-containing protein 5b n=1 Tax=Brachionichthys hirsutus TaxID=412623 RepID=UPI0036047E76
MVNKLKRRKKGEDAAFSPRCESVQQVKSEQRPSAASQPAESAEFRGEPPALRRYLEEIQTCNPAFPVRAVFGALQRKARLQPSGSGFEDVLWTDKYSPRHSSEVIGNSASVNELRSWLEKWKLRAAGEERRETEERKREDDSNDLWDCGDFQGEAGGAGDREEPLCKTMLITGPPGVGKTASVYACSRELGFKVFEVNCSSLRRGSRVLSQLKEATQSHLVDMPGRDPLRPAYLSSYSSAAQPEAVPGKTNRPLKNVASTSKRRAARKFCRSRSGAKAPPPGAAFLLGSYFKRTSRAVKPETPGGGLSDADPTVKQSAHTATSLILFEEVDVIFDDDVGFLAAIKTFMTSTKRPVVLTTNDPSFKERFGRGVDEVIFTTPSAGACSFLQLVALAEHAPLETGDVVGLLRASGGDVRRCLLQLQLWARSGAGRPPPRGRSPEELTRLQGSSVAVGGDDTDLRRRRCGSGCTASMLGLHPLGPIRLLDLLKASQDLLSFVGQCRFRPEADTPALLRLLAESWRRGVPLLYANLELLLTAGSKGTSVSASGKGTGSGSQSDPKAAPAGSKSVISRLNGRKRLTDAASSFCRTPSLNRTVSAETEREAARAEGDCLDALIDFFDLMSYLDSTRAAAAAALVSGPCEPGAFVWTGGEIKDGLLDEIGEEDHGGASEERLLDIRAAVEGLGCGRCLRRASEAWTKAREHKEPGDTRRTRLTPRLPASSNRRRLSFSLQPLCSRSVSHRRYELSRKVLGSEGFGPLGNRKAVWVDYMPVLRGIRRFQSARRGEEPPVRGPDYLSRINLGLSKSTVELLEGFS